MRKNNPLERSQLIETEFRDYLKATLEINNPELNQLFNEKLNKTELFKGPYISFAKPFVTRQTINEAIECGLLSKEFRNLQSIGHDFKLYEHQYQAIYQVNNNQSVVVTTGTGSGKTESFLFPILNDILKDIEDGKDYKGIRAVFLYPINALVNDQIERLRQILKKYPQITFGSYTGETPENQIKLSQKDKEDKAEGNFINYLPNEIRHREEMRINPPNLLFTNYAMLEYILIRPSDADIFNEHNTRNWKFMVLDEAHTYRGSLAIELSHLLRRVTGKYKQRNLNYILTSATLGRGEQDVDEIITFAQNLTGAHYDRKNILFAKRQSFEQEPKYAIDSEDYSKLLNFVQQECSTKLTTIYNKYGYDGQSREDLYDFLKYDDLTTFVLKKVDESNVMLVSEMQELLREKYGLNQDQFVDYIDLLSYAINDGQNLLVCKYHIFTKTPQGAYITVKPKPLLELSKLKEKNGQKYYELGVCRFCGTPYMVGNVKEEKQFITNDKTDIYENYDSRDSDRFKTDFLIFDQELDSDIVLDYNLVQYELCNKCGSMHRLNNINAKGCGCDSSHKVMVYHVDNKEDKIKNNLSVCPVCEGKHQGGIVRTFNIQKDETTAILGQINIESMYEIDQNEHMSDEVRRQLIAFSDSVQQATFYALFMEKNFARFLRKRLLIEVLNNEDHKVSYQDAIDVTKEIIEKYKLIVSNENIDEKVETEAHLVVLSELLKIDGKFGGEGLGLFHFRNAKITVRQIKKLLDERNFPNLNQKTPEEIQSIMQIAFDHFRMMPAIFYRPGNVDKETLDDELQYRSNDYYVAKIKTNTSEILNGKYVKSFLPSANQLNKKKTNKLFRYLSKVYQTEDTDLLSSVGDELWELGRLLNIFEFSPNSNDLVKLRAKDYEIVDKEIVNFYQCDHCNKVTIHNVNGVCPQDHCNGKLVQFDDVNGFTGMSKYYRDRYVNKRIERISIEEHTGQLGKKIGRINQQSFKENKINILSSTTTFEMGIDIGSLDNVFMRNIPPTPANYSQRAGRAGRRNGNAGFVMTYCGNSSHDSTYFNKPVQMIKGNIRTPQFKVNNRKIVIRHITAAALGYFFKLNRAFFADSDMFFYQGGLEAFIRYIESKPIELGTYIDDTILKDIQLDDLKGFNWIDEILKTDSPLMNATNRIKSEVNELDDLINKALVEIAKNKKVINDISLNYLRGQRARLLGEDILQVLSKNVVIPKYGFPVDVVQLDIYTNNTLDKKFEPSRDLGIAISEYAPESEIILNKKKYVSRYINFPYNDITKLPTKYYVKCPTCNRITASINYEADELSYCQHCAADFRTTPEKYIIPTYGFSTEHNEVKSTILKPKKTFSSPTYYLGGGISNNDIDQFGAILSIESSRNDELITVNENPFYVCPSCGYTKIIKEYKTLDRFKQFQDKKYHSKKYNQNKVCNNMMLERVHLAHVFSTDVVKITINEFYKEDDALSFLYAFLDGIALAFNIERNDINGVYNYEQSKTQFIIFDQVPGGAGHVKRIMSKESILEALKSALNIVDKPCCDETTSCYDCIRNYQNQTFHEKLKRGLAKNRISDIINQIESFQSKPEPEKSPVDIEPATSITVKDYGTSLVGKTLKEIIDYVFEDNITTDQRETLHTVLQLFDSTPTHFGTQLLLDNRELIVVDLYWEDSQRALISDPTFQHKSSYVMKGKNFQLIHYDFSKIGV